ncbi:class I SAM-dependent methyltransferase [Hymenobacter jeollabukensis]|uniref:DUF4942 domain-containing protein n=1 Tax=Hymenobacter jeollabukensis TaxID=2025313 RepID=A0A5R8WJ59_9BACT|nr:DUF4942 domain-containing protein [Hymenobacter jeollabukensis]TLM88815.1 DUF4942 domain-containing protein [Hymenobacter jeollabukensis]
MLNPEYYPTLPREIKLLLEPWLGQAPEWCERIRDYRMRRPALATMNILEPSAGSGHILDWMVAHIEECERGSYGWVKSKRMYACEIDPELKATLQGKNYKVIGDDFLSYRGNHQFDLVVMNPPFSQGDRHVLHAFDIVAPGGHVAALVNSETLRNPYTETRQLLAKLIEDHGSSVELGQVFIDSERPTDVEVSLIRLQKPAERDRLNFEFRGRSRERGPQLTEETFKSAVAVKDVIGNMMLGYEQVKEAFVDYMRARRALQHYSYGLLNQHQEIQKMADEAITEGGESLRACYNHFSDELKQSAWGQVMHKMGIEKYLTYQVQQDFAAYGRANGFMDFTKENVASLIELVMENKGQIMEQAVVAVFDEFTKYHKENRVHVEGWKTNDRWKVNRKVILPRWVRWDDWRRPADLKQYGSHFRLNSHQEYNDIDKVMCYLTGEDYDKCYTIERALETRFQRLGKVYPGSTFTDTCESQFFYLRFFKKGTLHLVFRDEKLWEEFNLRACAGKLWLPEHEMETYRKRKHSPFEQPAEPEPTPAPVAAPGPRLLEAPGTPAKPGAQLSLFGAFSDEPPALAA